MARTERRLLLLRHGKSSWKNEELDDRDRPLAARGLRDAPRMGRWMLEHALLPDRVLCSPARRARETLEGLGLELACDEETIAYPENLYPGPSEALLELIRGENEYCRMLLVVAHNPGLDTLLADLAPNPLARTPRGKLMTTCTLAQIELSGSWQELSSRRVARLQLVRPGDLD